ncbi:MAG: epoxide hydrolase [Acidobacteria bacterium]|nr:epoxide hydrolase [Acidobacteriota bacterium]
MEEPNRPVSRRALLKLVGATGAAAALAAGGRLPGGGPVSAGARAAVQGDPEPFEIRVSDEALDDLRRRLAAARWPVDVPGVAWSYGTDRAYLEELVDYWRNDYDWRTHEAALNAFDHYTTTVDGQRLHFVHQKGRGPSPFPLLMTHGWPGTIWEMLPSVTPLSDPAAHGGDAGDAFDVILPSIPGFGFSGEPAVGTDIARTAELWVALMDKLGYARFAAYGSDWGAGVTRHLGARFPDRLVGIHTPGSPGVLQREAETDEERAYLERAQQWSVDETGYQRIQGTKPQTLAYGLTDSPVGLAAWITEKLRSWSDSHGDVESRFTKDQILTLVSIYWHTNTIGTSVRYYYANGLGSSRPRTPGGPVRVPEGYAEFLGNPFRNQIPRSFVAELPDNVTHWSIFESGGHFPAIEEPELLVSDLRTFFRPLRRP